MRASFPTPLGPLITIMRGLGLGFRGSELKDEPKEASRARSSSERSALSRDGMGTGEGLRASPMWEKRLWVVEFKMGKKKLKLFLGCVLSGGCRDGTGRWVREEFKSLRIMEIIITVNCSN